MKILLAGAFGNLGSDILRELCRTEHDIIAADAVIRIPSDLDASRFTAKRELTEKPASRFEYFGTTLVEKWYNHSFTKTKAFRVTDSCVGCGLCAGNCPSNAIELKDGKPVWSKPLCIHCMACLNRCPKQAIEYGKKTVGKDRHVCPKYRPDRDR